MTVSSALLSNEDLELWFCLKSQPKHEHLAAAALRSMMSIEAFAPQLRFKKATTRGAVWFVEALFPGYLFAKFNYRDRHRQVQHSPGVVTIVRFGDEIACISENTITGLRELSGDNEVIVFNPEVNIGDTVQIVEGAIRGLDAVVTQLLPAKERIRILLDFLGRKIETEIQVPQVLPSVSPREGKIGRAKG
jgi:transcription antitermination factor NusG